MEAMIVVLEVSGPCSSSVVRAAKTGNAGRDNAAIIIARGVYEKLACIAD
jgi:hypothetical protein